MKPEAEFETVAAFADGWLVDGTPTVPACDVTAAPKAVGVVVEAFWTADDGEDSGTPIRTPIGFVSRARDMILPIGSGNKKAAITAAASNSAATGNATRRNRFGRSLDSPRHCCPVRNAILVGERPATFDFQQAFADHFRQHNQILWPLIRIRMQHPGKQGSQRFWKL